MTITTILLYYYSSYVCINIDTLNRLTVCEYMNANTPIHVYTYRVRLDSHHATVSTQPTPYASPTVISPRSERGSLSHVHSISLMWDATRSSIV